jgi:ribosomal protein L37E
MTREEIDCISREQAKASIRDKFKDLPSRVEINTILNELPSVTPTRKKGKWINIDETHSKCDRCGAVFEIASENGEANYCPNCGAEMESEE